MAYIVTCNEGVIWGIGDTEDAAWADMLQFMQESGVKVLEEDEDVPDDVSDPCNWTKASNFKMIAATDALVEAVHTKGGDVAWRRLPNGLACTMAEVQ